MSTSFQTKHPQAEASQHKQALRRSKRQARRQLSPLQQQLAARQLCRRIAASLVFIRARHVALYWPVAGEISPLPLLQHPAAKHKQWYLPVVRGRDMQFYRHRPDQQLVANRFAINEPNTAGQRPIKPWLLQLVIMPLVAFDDQRHRLGMGGGFYDRYLASRQLTLKRPYLLGAAHECQFTPAVPTEPWDIKLNAVASDQRWR